MSKKDLFYGDVEGRMEELKQKPLILSVALIVLVTIQPRQTQIFSTDATSNIGKPSYWSSQPIRKFLTLAISIALFILLLMFMIVSYK